MYYCSCLGEEDGKDTLRVCDPSNHEGSGRTAINLAQANVLFSRERDMHDAHVLYHPYSR
jgi:hypothetical protein